MTSLLSVAPAALGVLLPLPSHLYIPSASHLSTSNQIFAITVTTLIANRSLSILLRKVYPIPVQHLELLHIPCANWAAHMVIFSDRRHCHLVDVYTGTKVKPPKFRSDSNSLIYHGILMAPLNSPNSHLILVSRTSMLQWQVGTNSWTEHPLVGELILQIVFFKGQMFAIDYFQRLHIICLAPQLNMQEVAVVWEEGMLVGLHSKPWLVVCGDMLLLVDLSVSMDQLFGFPGTFQVFCLDFSDEPAKWVKMDKLDNWALFLTNDRRNPTISCMNPERWGGKSNHIYVPTASEDFDEPWTAIEVGQPVPSSTHRMSFSSAATAHCSPLNSLWVLPSLVYGVHQ